MALRSDANIMVVEDDDTFRRVVVQILENGGFKALPCRDFAEAIGVIESGQPVDLLLTDIGMPSGTPHGVSIAQMAKARRSRLKLLFMSGSYDAGLIASVIDGARFLAKPFRPEALLQAVDSALA